MVPPFCAAGRNIDAPYDFIALAGHREVSARLAVSNARMMAVQNGPDSRILRGSCSGDGLEAVSGEGLDKMPAIDNALPDIERVRAGKTVLNAFCRRLPISIRYPASVRDRVGSDKGQSLSDDIAIGGHQLFIVRRALMFVQRGIALATVVEDVPRCSLYQRIGFVRLSGHGRPLHGVAEIPFLIWRRKNVRPLGKE